MSDYETRLTIAAHILVGMIQSAPICDRTKINKAEWSKVAFQWADALITEASKPRRKP